MIVEVPRLVSQSCGVFLKIQLRKSRLDCLCVSAGSTGARAQVKCARLYASGVGAFLGQTKSSDAIFVGPMDATRIGLATDQSDASLPRSRFPARFLTGFNLL